MKYERVNYLHSNTKYLCYKDSMTLKELFAKLNIKSSGNHYSLLSAIKICNFFDISMEEILFQDFTKQSKCDNI